MGCEEFAEPHKLNIHMARSFSKSIVFSNSYGSLVIEVKDRRKEREVELGKKLRSGHDIFCTFISRLCFCFCGILSNDAGGDCHLLVNLLKTD